MAGRMEDLRTLLQGDDVYGDLLGDTDGDLVGDLLGDMDGDLLGAWTPGAAQMQQRVAMKLQRGPAHLSPQESAWLRHHLVGNQKAKRALTAMIRNFEAGAIDVRGRPPLVNRTPGVPQTTESRAFLPFKSEGGSASGTPLLQFTSAGGSGLAAMVASPQRPCRLHNLIADQSYKPAAAEAEPGLVLIIGFLVGQTSMFAASGGIPLSMFASNVFNSQFSGVAAGPGITIELQMVYTGTLAVGAVKTVTLGAFADQVI